MGLFSNLDKAQVTLGGNWLPPGGKFTVAIEAIKLVHSRKNKDLYTVELGVVESNHPSVKAGMKASWQVNLTDHGETAKGNIKGFIEAVVPCSEKDEAAKQAWATALKCEPDKVLEKLADMSLNAENPLRGQLVYVETTNIQTREKKSDFTKHVWSPVEEEKQKKSAEYRKAVGLAA